MRFLNCFLCGLFLCAHASAATLLPGEWLISSKVSVPGLKAQPQAITFRHCLKPADVESPAEAIARANEELKKQQCSLSDKVETDASVKYRMTCSGTVNLQADALFTFSESNYEGTVDMKVLTDGAAGMTMHNEVSAKRVGDCKK